MQNYSVLMSIYKSDNPEYLKQSIESMLCQTYKTDDFVIVCDGLLSDDLYQILETYKNKNYIHIVQLDKNVGLGLALNEGLKICKNELVARMDADDISYPERCECELKEFEKDTNLKMVGTFIEEFSEDPNLVEGYKKTPCTQKEIYMYAKRRNPFNHPTVMYKKSYIVENGGYSNLRKGQDFELFNRLVGNHMCCKNINSYLLKFRRDKNANNRRKSWDSVKTNILIIKASFERGYSSLYDLIYTYVTQVALLLLPEKIVDVIYSKKYRTSDKDR